MALKHFVKIFLAMAVVKYWPLYQLDMKNSFLHGDLQEEYVVQPPAYKLQGESRGVDDSRRLYMV